MTRSMKALMAVTTALLSWTPAHAAITLYGVPGAVQPDENVLLPVGQTGTTVLGETNQTHTGVTFQSLSCTTAGNCSTFGETLTTPANGQARIETTETPSSLSGMQFFLTDGGGFTEFEFNLFNSLNLTQSLTLFGLTGGVTPFSQTFNLDGNGQNFFAGLATGGDVFTKVAFDASGTGATDIRQIRIGGLGDVAVPEPGTWALMILGFGLIGTALRQRSRVAIRYS